MKKISLIAGVLGLLTHIALADTQTTSPNWTTIPVDKQLEVTLPNGSKQTITPSCAFDTLPNPTGGTPIDNSFHFLFKPGKNDRLVVFFNGGGACWDDATCVTSLVKGARPTYNPSVNQANSPIGAGGIFDDSNPDNPFKDWSKVFIPYCTGDVHAGSKTVTYHDDGSLTGYPGAPVTVNHRGFDNFLAVREWIKKRYAHHPKKLEKLLVAGSSAGGYGATLNFPYLQATFPKTNAVLLSDGATAIVTQPFLDSVFAVGGNWNVENTLSSETFGANSVGHFNKYTFNDVLLGKLSAKFPKSRFAQYTTAFDVVQVQFLKIMEFTDNGSTDPVEWGLSANDQLLFGEWNYRMETSLDTLSNSTKNYQYYIGAGTVHTVLTDAFAPDANTHPFYDENSAQGVVFTDWISRLVNAKSFHDQSVK